MGKVSAWGAVAAGTALAALSAEAFGRGLLAFPTLYAVSSALLLAAAFRTLRQMSGGLRLLCGAWGLTAGLALQRMLLWDARYAPGVLNNIIAVLSLAGLALTVLHKEKKA